MATCIKTGACVELLEYGNYIVCDIHEVPQASGESMLVLYSLHPPQWEAPRPVTHRARLGNGWMKTGAVGETTIVIPNYSLQGN